MSTKDQSYKGESDSDLPDDNHLRPLVLSNPPWKLRAEAWWFVLSIVGRMREWVGRSPREAGHQAPYPGPAHFDPLERGSRDLAEVPGAFRGGLGTVQLVRYEESPVGPYDELLIVPGRFALPPNLDGPASALRVTRIYVSTLQSIYNGRSHWNIPKHLARFEFNHSPRSPNELTVSIYALESFNFEPSSPSHGWTFKPQFSSCPFFSASIRNHFPRLSLPLDLTKIPMLNLLLCQPPIEAIRPDHPHEGEINCGLVGGSDWKAVTPRMKGRVGICSFKGNLSIQKGQFGDGKDFPDFEPLRFGFHWKTIQLEFPVGKIIPPNS